jgi:homopolymeric O-antigen transport system ATP-binding protein
MKAIIKVDRLSKQYRIGAPALAYSTLRESLVGAVRAPLDRLRRNGRSAEETFWALKDVSFEVMPGEALGIIGRNGAGKSTLLKILSRITEPTSGRVDLYGRVGSLLEVGTGFHPELTGRENIFLNGAILGMKQTEIQAKFDEIVAFAEVDKFLETPVKRYSSGMYVRLAFAVAAHLSPEILVIDEVLAVGDSAFQKKCLGKMQDVASQGRTVLFVSHNMAAVQRLCTRALLLEDGKVKHDGNVQSVVSNYQATGLKQQGERVWPNPEQAPGDDVVRLRAVRAVDASGQVTDTFKTTESFSVVIEYMVLTPGSELNSALYFYGEAGTLVFLAGDFQSDYWHGRTRPVGIHRSVCHVPGNFLNEGNLNVLVGVSTQPYGVRAIEPDALTIRISDDYQPGGARGNLIREWPGGVVRPLMEWTFEFEPLHNSLFIVNDTQAEKELP